MIDKTGFFGEILEQGATVVKQTIKQVAKTPGDLAKAGTKQIKGSDQAQAADQNPADDKTKTKEFVKDLYKPLKNSEPSPKDAKNPEETKEQKLAKLRQELHANYYQNLINPPKPKEEKAAEKVEREKKEERWELQEKEKKKPPPLAVQRAAQKAEKFPGASG